MKVTDTEGVKIDILTYSEARSLFERLVSVEQF